MTEEKRTALYVRVSTDKQEAENQLLQLREYAGRRGWKIIKEYVDVISGKETSRPAFDELFRDAHKYTFDIVLFWDLSRFSRAGVYHTIMKLKELENSGIAYVSYQEPYVDSTNSNPFREVFISLLATLAKIEREKISERTKAGLERAKKEGKRLGRHSRKYDFKRIWKEYELQGSISRTAKVLPYSYGTVHFIITHNIRTQEEYQRVAGVNE